MKVYLVTIEYRDYDCFDGHVVRASSEAEAREFCAKEAADEGPEVWLNKSKVEELTGEGEVGLILSSFNAG